MKKWYLLGMAAFATIAVLFSSCSKDDTSGDGNGITSLSLTLSRPAVELNGFDYVSIMVKDQNGKDVTSSSSIFLDYSQAIASDFVPTNTGDFKVTAKVGQVVSDTQQLSVTARSVSPFATKVLVEDITGTWCQYCPRVAYKLEDYKENVNSNLIVVGIHAGSSDPFKFQYYPTFNTNFGVTGYPAAILNRTSEWNESSSQLNAAFQRWTPVGISISSSLSGDNVTGTVKVKSNVTTKKPMKVVIALVENGLIYPQTNSTSYYGGADPISDFEHNGVLRKTFTSMFGDAIPQAQLSKNNEYSIPFSMSLSGTLYGGGSYTAIGPNCGIIAIVTDGTNNVSGIHNVQYANVGETKNYD